MHNKYNFFYSINFRNVYQIFDTHFFVNPVNYVNVFFFFLACCIGDACLWAKRRVAKPRNSVAERSFEWRNGASHSVAERSGQSVLGLPLHENVRPSQTKFRNTETRVGLGGRVRSGFFVRDAKRNGLLIILPYR